MVTLCANLVSFTGEQQVLRVISLLNLLSTFIWSDQTTFRSPSFRQSLFHFQTFLYIRMLYFHETLTSVFCCCDLHSTGLPLNNKPMFEEMQLIVKHFTVRTVIAFPQKSYVYKKAWNIPRVM